MRGGANQPLVGSYHRRLVLDAIPSAGTASRVELIEITGTANLDAVRVQ